MSQWLNIWIIVGYKLDMKMYSRAIVTRVHDWVASIPLVVDVSVIVEQNYVRRLYHR